MRWLQIAFIAVDDGQLLDHSDVAGHGNERNAAAVGGYLQRRGAGLGLGDNGDGLDVFC